MGVIEGKEWKLMELERVFHYLRILWDPSTEHSNFAYILITNYL